jgi:hypothetical protein
VPIGILRGPLDTVRGKANSHLNAIKIVSTQIVQFRRKKEQIETQQSRTYGEVSRTIRKKVDMGPFFALDLQIALRDKHGRMTKIYSKQKNAKKIEYVHRFG